MSLILRLLLFILASTFFLIISQRALKNPRSHGFFRFFIFEGILIIFLLNAPYWFHAPLSIRQIVSTALLFASIYCVVQGVSLLKRKGGQRRRDSIPENLGFENTEHLVTEGIFAYIRHPMYTSLLLLAWGLFLKNITLIGLVVVITTTVFVVVAARVEEGENIAFWGLRYRAYMRRTHRFIPFLY